MEERLKTSEETTAKPLSAAEKQAAAKKEYERLLSARSGGTYVPPARLRALQADIGHDPQSKEFQRMAWEALKKSINGLINKVNISNIKHIVPELFGENLIRGRGLFCRSLMKAQAASLPFTHIYAAMVAVVNTKLPQVGELLVNRLIIQFRKGFKRNDKKVCLSSTTFLAHLINQQVVHEMLAAQILLLLLNKPTDDSVEIAVGLMKEVGSHLEEFQAKITMAVYDQFRNILHEADIDKRGQYMIEVLFQIRKDKYEGYPSVKEELDLVEEEDQITHNPGLDDDVDVQDELNVFKFDTDYEENEEAYKRLKAEILGEDDDDGSDDDADSDASSEDEEVEAKERAMEIKDQSNADLVNLRRNIYLTIMSSGTYEECTHKLLRVNLPPGYEHELPSMLIECCSQDRTYSKFYGLIGERLCKLNRMWTDLFEQQFEKYYTTIHRFDNNRLRIIGQFFGHLFTSNAIGWHSMSAIHINEQETTASSRIFVKVLFEDLAQGLGMKKLSEQMKDESLQPYFSGIFPTDDPRNTRFSINFFTAIGMGALTEGMRQHLESIPKPQVPALRERSESASSRSVSSYSSYSSYTSESRSRSPSDRGRGRSYTRSQSPRRRRSYSRSRSDSRLPRRRTRDRSFTDSRSVTPARRNFSDSISRSRSPPRRRTSDSVSRSRSPRRGADAGSRSAPSRRNGKPSIASRSRSPLPRRSKKASDSRSRSPVRSRSPARRSYRARSYSDSRSRSPARDTKRQPGGRRRSASLSRSHSPIRGSASGPGGERSRKDRRRRSPSPESRTASESRSRSPPPRRKEPVRPVEAPPAAGKDDLNDIHPSRRGLVAGGDGGGGGRAGRGGYGGGGGGRGRGRPTADSFL